MHIKLTEDLPVAPEHGMTAGRICEVLRYVPATERQRGGVAYFVAGDAGKEIGVLEREAQKASQKDVMLADDRQYPALPTPGLWRLARKGRVCKVCDASIAPRTRYFEYTGDVPGYQSGTPYCRRCAIEVWL